MPAFLTARVLKYVSTGIAILIFVYFSFSEIKTMITNNTTLRKNISELEEKNSILNSNYEELKEQHKQEIKANTFNTKIEIKNEIIQNRVDSYKNPIKEKNVKIIDLKPVYFPL